MLKEQKILPKTSGSLVRRILDMNKKKPKQKKYIKQFAYRYMYCCAHIYSGGCRGKQHNEINK